MDQRQRKALAKLGGRVTTVSEFLELTPAEEALIEVRLALRDEVIARRKGSGMTQQELATRIGSTQPRVAKMEGGDPHASIEFMLRAVVALGGRPMLRVSNDEPQRAAAKKRVRRAG